MGTALTAQQLRELRRLCSRLFLCFDADKAGQEATLRGMELAYREFAEVRVIALPKGSDPADAAAGFAERLQGAESYPRHRVRLEIERAPSKEAAFQRVREIVAGFDRNTEAIDAVEFAADRLDLPRDLQAALMPRASRATGEVSRKILEAGDSLERSALAGCLAHPGLVRALAEISPDHFALELHRRMREALVAAERTRRGAGPLRGRARCARGERGDRRANRAGAPPAPARALPAAARSPPYRPRAYEASCRSRSSGSTRRSASWAERRERLEFASSLPR